LGVKKILVVEDDPVGGLVLLDFLDAHGYRTSLARTGPDGVQAFAKDRPDLMIVDVLLPMKNGFEVCFEVKRTPEGSATPILLMSAIYKGGDAEDYAKRGVQAEGFIAKPFDLKDLLSRVRAIVGEA
jgi:two-component system alkaline phosphatase synthesis response regulator PhoP